ncbi:MAG TPA: T9SS type A sorting domain-containing protein, partial [Bacteroidota bacterium]|nr:T9SS type A sorting domain-containing protein [Bacteroidota bacterium]
FISQNYPNPFNPSTTIGYGLPHRSHVTIGVFNALGQLLVQLVDAFQEAGYHETIFDGMKLASGVYFCRLQADTFAQTVKIVLVR